MKIFNRKACSPFLTIIYMCNIVCITNRNICPDNFLDRIENIAEQNPAAIVLREKDMNEKDYIQLCEKVMKICEKHNVKCILHSFYDAAVSLNCTSIHLPIPVLQKLDNEKKSRFSEIGTSCHSIEDAVFAEKTGCSYIIAGHIFETDCKKGVAPRGLDFLRKVCESVSIPVYAIGGINHANFPQILQAGAKGGCVMSGLMRCGDIKKYMSDFKNDNICR